MTTPSRRTLLRAAGRIHDQYLLLAQPRSLPLLPVPLWEQCARFSRQIRLARQYGLPAAATGLQQSLVRHLNLLAQQCRDTAGCIHEQHRPVPAPEQRLLYAELVALVDEFDHVEIALRRGELAVTTGPIELEGILLGQFEIRLDYYDLGDTQPYRVIALDPRPAESDSEMTHPHVQSDRLCEGDARRPIREALRSGRLSDFFLIVASTLQTYNGGSAYVALDDWDSTRCPSCDDTVRPDELSYCEKCSNRSCHACSWGCEDCGYAFCGDCIDRCGSCEEPLCHSCLTRCAHCRRLQCADCLTDTLCAACCEAVADEPSTTPDNKETTHADPPPATAPPAPEDVRSSPPEASSPPPTATQTTVHADGLGQAALPA